MGTALSDNPRPEGNAPLDSKGPFAPLDQFIEEHAFFRPQVAFLAMELLTDEPRARKYKHDLESIIWSILFIFSSWIDGWRIVNLEIEKWWTNGWERIGGAKAQVLAAEAATQPLTTQFAEGLGVDPLPLQECMKAWVDDLISGNIDPHRMLFAVRKARETYEALL